jgi:hypothetical protein
MPASFGVTDQFGGTAPTGGWVQSSESTETCEVATIRNETGATIAAQAKGVATKVVVIKSKGDVSVTAPSTGSVGTGKVTSAKVTESNDDFSTAEVTFTSYATI